MSYRDTAESLRARRDHISAQLAQARAAAREAEERAGRVATLEKELAEVDTLLQSGGWKKALPLLENLQIASPCSANWDEMAGDDRVRFCGQCEKNVHNLSAMPRAEAEALLVAKEGEICVRLYRRADGTVISADCPVGARRKRRRRAAVAAVGGGLLAVTAAALGARPVMQGEAMPRMDRQSRIELFAPKMGGSLAPRMRNDESFPTMGAPLPVPQDQVTKMGKPSMPPEMGRRVARPQAQPAKPGKPEDVEPMMGLME
jgi:hypothetical protein